jgi:dTDP-4-dehydrorhamnose reductase
MTDFRIMLLGKGGQVGSALLPHLATRGIVVAHDRNACDLQNSDQIRSAIRHALPDVIINAAAYTAVDHAECERKLCYKINGDAPRVIADEAANIGATVVHFSTDYVFDGAKQAPYAEDDKPLPVNVYGQSKLAGDVAVLSYPNNVVLRVSWVFGLTGNNFAKTILRLAAERDELRIVADQYGVPTSADLIADMTARVADRVAAASRHGSPSPAGLFNLAPAGRISWHDYAVHLVREARSLGIKMRATEDSILPIPSDEYPTAAARPKNSSLDTSKFESEFAVALPEWRIGVADLLNQLAKQTS